MMDAKLLSALEQAEPLLSDWNDPMGAARILVQEYCLDDAGRQRLMWWRGQWWWWTGRYHKALPAEEVEAVAWLFLDKACVGSALKSRFKPTRSKVGAFISALKAVCYLPSTVRRGWRDGPEMPEAAE